MKIILDTDKKTITVPYNYTDKLAEINRIAQEFGGENVESKHSRATLTRFGGSAWQIPMRML